MFEHVSSIYDNFNHIKFFLRGKYCLWKFMLYIYEILGRACVEADS
jgi:hypothetical protein